MLKSLNQVTFVVLCSTFLLSSERLTLSCSLTALMNLRHFGTCHRKYKTVLKDNAAISGTISELLVIQKCSACGGNVLRSGVLHKRLCHV